MTRHLFDEEMRRVAMGACPICAEEIDADGFRDELSRREHGISGMCQACQDAFFDGGDDE